MKPTGSEMSTARTAQNTLFLIASVIVLVSNRVR